MDQFIRRGKTISLLILGALLGGGTGADSAEREEKHSLARVEALASTPCSTEYSAYAQALLDIEAAQADLDAAEAAADVAWDALEECLNPGGGGAGEEPPEIETFDILEK